MSRHWLLAVTALAFAAVLARSALPWAMTNRPGFDRIAVLPAPVQRPMRHWLDDHGIRLPWPGLPEAEQPVLTLGYAYRGVSAVKLPFVGYADPGLVLYDGRGRWGPPVPLDQTAQAELRRLAGRDLAAEHRFAWWRFSWGWLFVAALSAWYWLHLRTRQRLSAAAGIL